MGEPIYVKQCLLISYILYLISCITYTSASAAGPFSPQISPEGIARVPPTQLGPAPVAELPRGGAKKNAEKRHTTSGRGSAQISVAGSAALSIPAADTLPAALCAVRGMNRCALATGMTKFSLPKGKYSAHQPAPKHLTNHPMFCSDSIKPIVRAGLGAMSHAIIPVG